MTVRLGFLGGGFIASYHALMLQLSGADAELAVVHDPDAAKAAHFAATYGASVADSEDELLSSVDAVYVCTWTAEHPRLVEAAASRGLPVFCEKPLGVDLAAAWAMADIVQHHKVINQVGLVLRDSPALLLLRHLVQSPESGRVMSVVFRDDQYIPVQGQYASTWRGDPALAGSGALLEHSIHDVDVLEWLLGPVDSVSGLTRSFHGIDGIEDAASVNLAFASGAVGTLTSVWHDVLARPSLRRIEVLCERGFYVLEEDTFGPVHWERDGDRGSLEGDALMAALADAGIPTRYPDAGFVECVATGLPATPTFADALRARVLVDAVYRSAADGGVPVDVRPATS